MVNNGIWDCVPIGNNLVFDLTFLWEKFKKYNLSAPTLSEYLYNKPRIDIKPILIMANKLEFKGAGLDKITKKETNGRRIPIFYAQKEFNKIEDYIKQETEAFLEFFQKCMIKFPGLKNEK